MPKYGIHYIVLKKAAENLSASSLSHESDVGNLLAANEGMANLGAIGPDVFFWAPDYELVNTIDDMYRNIKSIIKEYNKIVEPIRKVKEAVGDAAEELVGDLSVFQLIKTLVEEIDETSNLLCETIKTGLFAGVISVTDFVSQMDLFPNLTHELFTSFAPAFQHQLQNGETLNEKKWYWFDMLHYRRTGLFAKNLINRAQNGSNHQKAYANGYLSHIATDVIGHPFVNQVVGGPYRLNVQRHSLVENYMDAWAFQHYFNGENINKTLLSRLKLPAPDAIGDDVFKLLDGAFRDTYGTDICPTLLGNPGYLSMGQLKDTYELFYDVLTTLQGMSVERPQEPFSNVADILRDALEDLMEAPPSPPPLPNDITTCSWEDIFSLGLTSSSRDCYEEFFEQVERYAGYLGELLVWALETIGDLIDLIITTLASLPVMVLLALLYGIQLLIYELYQLAKKVIAEYGLSYPEPHLLKTGVGLAAITTFLNCANSFKYPRHKTPDRSHFVCPQSQIESPGTMSDFNASSLQTLANTFIDSGGLDLSTLGKYADAENPDETRQLQREHLRIGSAVKMAKWIISNANNPNATPDTLKKVYADWNLDSDRGYGYKNWKGSLDAQINEIVDEDYLTK